MGFFSRELLGRTGAQIICFVLARHAVAKHSAGICVVLPPFFFLLCSLCWLIRHAAGWCAADTLSHGPLSGTHPIWT